MQASEVDDQRLTAGRGEFLGSDRAVIAVRAHPRGQREMETVEHGSDRTCHRPEVAGPLADVVEQRGADRGCVTREGSDDALRHLDRMSLIGRPLVPEQLDVPGPEVRTNEFLLAGCQRPRGEETEKALREVPAVSKPVRQCFDLQSTHSREVGRKAIRSEPISLPHTAQMP